MELSRRVDQRQTQTTSQSLSPRLQHAVRLLQMSSLDFAAALRDTLVTNPFLEVEDDGDMAGEVDDEAGGAEGVPAHDHDQDNGFDHHDHDDRDLWQAEIGSSARVAHDGALSALEMVAAESTLNAHLHFQLNLLSLPQREVVLARAIVESLDDDGYLRTPLDELLSLQGIDASATLADLQSALACVQSLEPAGVAARDVAECLQLQLASVVCAEQRALASRIVGGHMAALASCDIAGLARRLGVPAAQVAAACECIRRLDPRPGWRFGPGRVHYLVPDVVARKVRGRWTVQLNPASVPRVRLNEVYADMFKRHRSRENAELAGQLQDARWTVGNVAQRLSTIRDVAAAIVKRQRHFLDFGPMAMKPLGLREIADEIGVHESTVSRVTNNKFIATPSGVFELKYFFSRALVSANGSACSGTAIRGLVKDMLDTELPADPLSDVEIAARLKAQGLAVARRTVTKYRQQLRIEPAERRRRSS